MKQKPCRINLPASGLLFLSALMILFALFSSCRSDRNIASRSTISGTVNGSPVQGMISATFYTGRGGNSSCTFSKLPAGFNPGTFGSHL